MAAQKYILDAIDGGQTPIELTADQVALGLTRERIFYCEHCTQQEMDGLIYHLKDDNKEMNWEEEVQQLQQLAPTPTIPA